MTNDENETRSLMRDAVTAIDPSATREHTLQVLDQNVRKRKRAVWLTTAASFAVGSLAAVGLLAGTNMAGFEDGPGNAAPQSAIERNGDQDARSESVGAPVDGPVGLVGPGEPCLNAQMQETSRTTLIGLPGRVFLPPVGTEPVTRAWVCGVTPVLMFNTVQASFESGWSEVDLDAKWAALISQNGGQVEEIQGRPALVRSASSDGEAQQILLVAGDTLVRLLATEATPIDRLRQVASELVISPAE